MTEREKRNDEMKQRIMRDAQTLCEYIDLMEAEIKARERVAQTLSEALDRQHEKVQV